MNLEDIRIALAVERAGSLSGASDLLGISPPTLSKAIARLERAHKFQLFERLPKGMRPTEMGAAFLKHARGIDLLAGDLYAALRDLRQARSGVLRIGFGQGVPDGPLVGLTTAIGERGIHLELSGGMTDTLTKAVALGELEFAMIGLNAPPGDRLVWRPLRADPMVPVVAQDHPLAEQRLVNWPTLARQRWIVPAKGTSAFSEYEQNFRAHGLEPPVPWMATRSAGRDVVLAAANLAIVLAPAAMAQSPKLAGRLHVVRAEGGWPSARHLGLIHRSGGYLSPMALWAMEIIEASMGVPSPETQDPT